MIPNSPNWSLLTTFVDYPTPTEVKPEISKKLISDTALGPDYVGDGLGKINVRYWSVIWEKGQFSIYRVVNGELTDKNFLLAEADDVERVAMTFDQLGRPLLFYKVRGKDLRLYWYDPIAGGATLVSVGEGRDPVAGFDMAAQTGLQYSDAMLFYVKNDRAYMLVQRERFETHHETSMTLPGLELVRAALRKDNRFQLQARIRKEDSPDGFVWKPEDAASAVWKPKKEIL